MAMSMEQVNRKLEKVLEQLDSAIEDRDLAKVDEAINKAQMLNKKSEGQRYEEILTQLNERINNIVEEIKPDKGLDIDEKSELANIKKKIKEGKDPFEQTKAVVDSLGKKGINQEDLKLYKEEKKKDNIAQIDAVNAINQELAFAIVDIEMRYMKKIENNDEAITIIKDIKKQKDLLVTLDPATDAETISATKADIKAKISELEAKGIDVTEIQSFESNPNVIDRFETTKTEALNIESDNTAKKINKDVYIKGVIIDEYELGEVTNAKDLKDKYKKMVLARRANASKITTLEAENKQIEDTIKTLEKEDKIRGIAYNADGNEKSNEEIGKLMLEDKENEQTVEDYVKQQFSGKFDGNFFERFGARMQYYKENGSRSFKAFWQALGTPTSLVKRKATIAIAGDIGKSMADRVNKRQNVFKDTIKKEAAREMTKNPQSNVNSDIIVDKAYERALKDDIGDENVR